MLSFVKVDKDRLIFCLDIQKVRIKPQFFPLKIMCHVFRSSLYSVDFPRPLVGRNLLVDNAGPADCSRPLLGENKESQLTALPAAGFTKEHTTNPSEDSGL